MNAMEETFQTLAQNGQNNVVNLIQLMKDSNVINSGQEGQITEMFQNQGADPTNVSYNEFSGVVDLMATQQGKSKPNIMQRLAHQSGAFSKMIGLGAKALQGYFHPKKSERQVDPLQPQLQYHQGQQPVVIADSSEHSSPGAGPEPDKASMALEDERQELDEQSTNSG